MATTILQPGEIEASASAIPTIRLPSPGLFAVRARRLHALAPGHPLAGFLGFAAALAERQEAAWPGLARTALPPADQLARCREAAMPPLAPPAWWPAAHWRDLVRSLATDLTAAVPGADTLAGLAQADDDWLEVQARLLLAGDAAGLDLAAAPLIGAALQVHWSAAAAQLSPADLGLPAQPAQCPVCGSPPVAAVLRSGGAQDGLRYLHCSLCATEWHVVRAKCSLCDNARGVTYLSLEGAAGDQRRGVEAEACPECHGYLKLCRLDQDPALDPWADDLATLALDLLVDQEGFERAGLNFLLLQGSPIPS
ncbi:MAG TPA: formate dehydrogenase accessory protein FdhE [Lamprocystis sp. (in: g-proteobacteria)]|nr:formate dehydrogenase accessory protein FdhE [Lamprocystis sp. (in: g-proteobacteria)]